MLAPHIRLILLLTAPSAVIVRGCRRRASLFSESHFVVDMPVAPVMSLTHDTAT